MAGGSSVDARRHGPAFECHSVFLSRYAVRRATAKRIRTGARVSEARPSRESFDNGQRSNARLPAANICEALGDHALPNAAQKGREFVKLEFNEDKIAILAESIYRAVIR